MGEGCQWCEVDVGAGWLRWVMSQDHLTALGGSLRLSLRLSRNGHFGQR